METAIEARDGAWTVGDAGEVDFVIRDRRLELIDVRERPGWTHAIKRNEPDRLEVDFVGAGVEWEFSATYRSGRLKIGIEQDIEPAEPGRYPVGPAGEVEIGVVDGALQLVDTAVNPGWHMTVEEDRHDEIEVEFHQGPVEWEFEAELDGGQLEVEIDCEVEGTIPPDTTG